MIPPTRFLAISVLATLSVSADFIFSGSNTGQMRFESTEALSLSSVATIPVVEEVLLVFEGAYIERPELKEPQLDLAQSLVLSVGGQTISLRGAAFVTVTATAPSESILGVIDQHDLVLRLEPSSSFSLTFDDIVEFSKGSRLTAEAFPLPTALTTGTQITIMMNDGAADLVTTVPRTISSSIGSTAQLESESARVEMLGLSDDVSTLRMFSQRGDRVLEWSEDMVTWTQSMLFLPEGRQLEFDVSNGEQNGRFYRLGEAQLVTALTSDLFSVSGKTIQFPQGTNTNEFSTFYEFFANGTGRQFLGSPEMYDVYNFTWNERSEAGMNTVNLVFPDQSREQVNFQKSDSPLVNEADSLYFMSTLDLGRGSSAFTQGGIVREAMAPDLPVDPGFPSLIGREWNVSIDKDLTTVESSLMFTDDGKVTGFQAPGITEVFTRYQLFNMGINTWTLDLISNDGPPLRIFGLIRDSETVDLFANSLSYGSFSGMLTLAP